jgi:hypothetical protein
VSGAGGEMFGIDLDEHIANVMAAMRELGLTKE